MQFGGDRKNTHQRQQRGRGKPQLRGGADTAQYSHRLQFYRLPPTDNICLNEFEEFAISRVKVLRHVEQAGQSYVRGTDKYKEYMDKELRHLMPLAVRKDLKDDFEERRKDHISHFILRLAYCKSEDLRRWFIAQEMDLFRYRFLMETDKREVARFLQENDLHFTPIPDEEKQQIAKYLCASSYSMSMAMIEHTDFYKVPFTEALDLVRGRKVYLHRGWAYVPHNDLVSIILSAFRSHLSQALAVTARSIPHLEEDDRLLPMLNNLSKQYLGQNYSSGKSNTGKIELKDMDTHARKSFPLCMRQLHSALRENHHLRHHGRMQYGLFLKGIGLTLEQALTFWRSEFSKIMDGDKFEKQYSYNVRHSYGKEGKRTDYTPYSCMKIIMTNAPATGDHHGCPFRHTDSNLLKQRLAAYKVNQSGIDEIIDLVNKSHYQVACSKYFMLTHSSVKTDVAIQHPNQYFEESQKILSGDKKYEGSSRYTSSRPMSQPAPSPRLSSQMSSEPTSQTQSSGQDQFDDELNMSFEELEAMEKEAMASATTA
ncbi:DNA primase large subunit-like [Patiria miniata]|uniref:DNA primase large subunit n=1 Tax=Patiria miniata TaxID=46514 RepID=A0A914A229_PATMI|nr:DNA primase large subunit-like [Patiria miniata]